jgi:TolB-like protein/class 3 adenylate cyclase/Tfp pilus assembly protein PilF
MSHSRQLAAIMFADIVGYTALMQEDETFAMQLRNKLKKKLEKEITTHNGRILEFRGDGALCSFMSTIEGVLAALALQLDMQTIPIVPLRIGIHTGDVMMEDDNIYGDGVNIASRIESFAVPGSIFISGKVYDDIKNQKDIQIVSLGKYALKNVKEQVEIFAISNKGIFVPERNSLEGKGEKVPEKKSIEKSIAVLPFVNMSNDPEQEYFSDGMTEEIVNSLSHVKDLKVAGRSSSFQFKGKNIDMKEVGEKLKVLTVLEGSVRKQGNRLRITVQLINAEDGYNLWSERYDREIDDIFALQDEIALTITEKLKITLLEREKAIIQKGPAENKEAYDLYLKGRFYFNKRGAGIIKGLEYFQQALEKDPSLTLAYTGMADAYYVMAFWSVMPPHDAMPKARQYAEKAIQLQSSQAEAYTALAFVSTFYDWNWMEAKKQFQHVFELSPNHAPAHYWYCYYLSFVERKYEESIRVAKNAAEHLEPLVPRFHHALSVMYICAGRFEEGLRASEMAIELDANSFFGYRGLGLTLAGLNKYAEAIEALKTAVLLSLRQPLPLVELSWVYSLSGNESEVQKILDELIMRSQTEYISALFICCVAYYSKNYSKAIGYLEQAFEQRDSTLPCIKVHPISAFIRTDPRFQPFLERMNFPE